MNESLRRQFDILERMKRDPLTQIVLARMNSTTVAVTGNRPTSPVEKADDLTEVVVARVSAVMNRPRTQTDLTTPVQGRLVRAGEPNMNGTMFTEADLKYGLQSLLGAPLTFNHVHARGAYGWIDSATLDESPDAGIHTVITGQVWTARFPNIAESLHSSIANGTASLSMECLAQEVLCLDPNCGKTATNADNACEHILKQSAARRMVNPTFYGAGLILDGVKPGWPGASLKVGR